MELPARGWTELPRCRCVVMDKAGTVEDWCGMDAASPDEPFCLDCRDRHPYVGENVVVTARRVV